MLAETTKVKTILLMERRSSKENSVVFLVEGKEFKLRICLRGVCSAANLVSITLEFTAFVAALTANLAEVAPSGLFCPQPWFLRESKHIFPGETPVFIVTQ